MGGLLVAFGDVLLGQRLTETGVLVVHAVLPFWILRPGHSVARHGPAGLLGHGVPDGWAELHRRGRGWGRLGTELQGEAGDDHGEGQGQGGQQGQAAPDQHPAEPAVDLTAGRRWVELHGGLLSWMVLHRWQQLLVRNSVIRPSGRAVVAGWQRGGSAGAWGVRACS
jgi:hypothetical protein